MRPAMWLQASAGPNGVAWCAAIEVSTGAVEGNLASGAHAHKQNGNSPMARLPPEVVEGKDELCAFGKYPEWTL